MTDRINARTKVGARRHELETIRATLTRFDRTMPIAIVAVSTLNNGWPEHGGDGGSPTGISDPVGRQVARLSDAIELEDQLFHPTYGSWTMLVTLVGTIRNQIDTLAKISGANPDAPPPPVLCSGGAGMDGAIEWGDPTCEQHVHATGLCASCWSAHRRWKTARDNGRQYSRRPRTVDATR